MASKLSCILLRTAAAVNFLSIVGHTKMGFDDLFPALKPLGQNNRQAGIFKIGWLEVNTVMLLMGILCLKWANTGLTDNYEKAVFGCFTLAQTYFGFRYTVLGVFEPLISLWLTPVLMVASQLV
ncbi:hypothetical protein MMC06_003709 [Schaereria dolodes]|nr:hypothetical protein [Schaereria dolodes]